MFNLFRKKSSEDKVDQQLDINVRYILSWDKNLPLEEKNIDKYECKEFCGKLLEMSESKFFSRQDIQKLSERLGYSVWARRGGDGCPHIWEKIILQKKNS